MLTFTRYIEVYFKSALVDFRCNEEFVNSRFCSIHFTVILARLNKIVRYTEDLVIKRLVKSRFYCINFDLCRNEHCRKLTSTSPI